MGAAITLYFFLWAVRNGQFKDQQRARFLPLTDEEETTPGGGMS